MFQYNEEFYKFIEERNREDNYAADYAMDITKIDC